MEYKVLIDESGTINNFKKGIFEVCLLFVLDHNFKKTKSFFSNLFTKFKEENNISQDVELKAHYLKENKYLNIMNYVFYKVLTENKVVSVYIDNRNRKNKNISPDEIFYKMIAFAIKRAKDRKYIEEGDILEIYPDKRKLIIFKIKKLSKELISNHNITLKKFKFLDSNKNIMIQVVDHLSFMCNRIIIYALKNKKSITNIPYISFIQVYY